MPKRRSRACSKFRPDGDTLSRSTSLAQLFRVSPRADRARCRHTGCLGYAGIVCAREGSTGPGARTPCTRQESAVNEKTVTDEGASTPAGRVGEWYALQLLANRQFRVREWL